MDKEIDFSKTGWLHSCNSLSMASFWLFICSISFDIALIASSLPVEAIAVNDFKRAFISFSLAILHSLLTGTLFVEQIILYFKAGLT